MFQIDIITIFPDIFNSYFNTSIIKRAQDKKLIKIKIINLRNFTRDKHKTVDDKPYGGGPGMILRPDVIYRAIVSRKAKRKNKKGKVILFTPTGKQFNQRIAKKYTKLDYLILVSGHYEGIDARVNKFVDEKISIGPYILTGGELPAMIVVDAVTRLISGVIKPESLEEETELKICLPTGRQENSKLKIIAEYPQYTRPEVLTIRDKCGKKIVLRVPKILLSGNHKKIKEWRQKHRKQLTKKFDIL